MVKSGKNSRPKSAKRILPRRIFLSAPADEYLTPSHCRLKAAIVEKIRRAGFAVEFFYVSGLSKDIPWTFDNVRQVMRRCSGAVILGLPRFEFVLGSQRWIIPTEYNHYEGAIAHELGLPVLTITQDGMANRGVFWNGGGKFIVYLPPDANAGHIRRPIFKERLSSWLSLVNKRYDVFLGYCGSSTSIAVKLLSYLRKDLALTVCDWQMDFAPAGSILERLTESARDVTAAIFLFTKDDKLKYPKPEKVASPRDNVLFEAGFFIQCKGKGRVLIIREAGAKMPADLGGDIYASLPDQSVYSRNLHSGTLADEYTDARRRIKPNIEKIKRTVYAFIRQLSAPIR